jgi:hypothetical protein
MTYLVSSLLLLYAAHAYSECTVMSGMMMITYLCLYDYLCISTTG